MIPNVLSIGGTDPSGGAGIHADLKAMSANGAYAMAVITSLVAQTTTGVSAAAPVDPAFVAAQLDTLCADVRVDAVKIGLLPNPQVVAEVAAALDRWHLPHVVVDPVLVAKSGHRLADADTVEALRRIILPRADLVTPNLDEAAALLDDKPAGDVAAMHRQAAALLELGPARVLLKGGHLPGPTCVDVLVEGALTNEGPVAPGGRKGRRGGRRGGARGRGGRGKGHGEAKAVELAAPRIATTSDHGTGCTLSSAIAALRARGETWVDAVTDAKRYLTGALAAAVLLDVGHGHGPVHHFFQLWPPGDPPAAAEVEVEVEVEVEGGSAGRGRP